MALLDARLGLTILDAIGTSEEAPRDLSPRPAPPSDAAERRIPRREGPAHPLFTALASDGQQRSRRGLVNGCAFGAGLLPDEPQDQLTAELRTGNGTIRERVTRKQSSPTFRAPARSNNAV